MKKVKMIALAILAGLMCVACTPKKEKLLCAYEEAAKNGDAIEAMKIISEMEAEFGEAADSIYTEAEQLRFETATAILQQEMNEKAMEQLGGAMQQLDKTRKAYSLDEDDDEDEDDE